MALIYESADELQRAILTTIVDKRKHPPRDELPNCKVSVGPGGRVRARVALSVESGSDRRILGGMIIHLCLIYEMDWDLRRRSLVF